jgi:Leucine rich repeat
MIILTVKLFVTIKANRINCESITNSGWSDGVGTVLSCYMEQTSSITEPHVSFSSANDKVLGLRFYGNKKIHYLPVHVSHSFPNLRAYTASMCSLTTISKENFKGLKHLRNLYLHTNQIERIKRNTFEDLTSLELFSLRKIIILCS